MARYDGRPAHFAHDLKNDGAGRHVDAETRNLSPQAMEVRVSDQDLEKQLADLAASTGRAPDELVEDALFAYFAELTNVSETLDRRYDDLKGGRVVPIDGGAARTRLHTRIDGQRTDPA